jgi:hypothetical protein
MATIATPHWNGTHLAVHRENLIGQSGQSELSLLRHPSYPFLAEISDDPSILFKELRSVAEDYLDQVACVVPRDDPLIKALEFLKGKKPKGFGWLPITWDGTDGLADPRGSFVVRRRSRRGTELDRTIVLMAGNRELKGKRKRKDKGQSDIIEKVDGLAVGLRVVMHADPPVGRKRVPIRVTGLSMSELRRAVDPDQARHFHPVRVNILAERVAQRLGFDAKTVKISGYERLTGLLRRVAGVGARSSACGGTSQGFLWEIEARVDNEERLESILAVREQEQRTFSALEDKVPRLFYRDPASCEGAHDIRLRYPTGDEKVLDDYREDAPFLRPRLEDEGRFQVLKSHVADLGNNAQEVQTIDPLELPLRSDHLSAAQAYLRAREFLHKLSDFDLPEKAYFKFARLPLLMRHRACFDAHPDGKAVMAQVRLPDAPAALFTPSGKFNPSMRPRLEVAFGAAELRHRDAREDDHGRESAQPLGLAADPRWAWHEFGHVVSYAATGALEYQFAHSVGDALAAVLNDATSELRKAGLYAGETYPWAPAGRRHDRDAAAGWCWCGRRNGQRHAAVTFPPRLYKGYVEEQMLSSSVFRFYRAIGGHPDNDETMRKRAADAAAYLLMRSALLLGPGALVPARSADALVSAMIDADIGTRRPRNLFLGGCLHKVVRWAFERQGLFATASPEENAEGPGLPPAVDLWVMDRRPNAKDGGYEPVTLGWPTSGREPDWFATGEKAGVWRDASGNIHVIIRNRGTRAAADVTVRAWWAPVRSGSFDWRYLGDSNVDEVPAGGDVSTVIKARLSGARRYLLVEVSSSEDASNMDAQTYLPCASRKPQDRPPAAREAVRDLVANDNNLALRLIP